MNVFLTGGTGFIGSHVAMELLRRGHAVTILARNPDKIPAFREMKGLSFVKGALADEDAIREGLRGRDACVHLALNYQSQRGWKAVLDDTVPTVSLAVAAADAGVKHFIYTSSTSVNDDLYDSANRDPDEVVVLTPERPPSPATFYGATKAACENYMSAVSYQTAMRVNIIRPGYVYGNPVAEGAPTEGDPRFPNLARAVLAGEPIELDANDGTQFIWADDIALVYAALLESGFNRKTYFALSQNYITWGEIAKMMIAKTGSKSELKLRKGEGKGSMGWGVEGIRKDFGLVFDAYKHMSEHVDYWLGFARSSAFRP
jgi:UDP-glucose 4-epimerase